MEQGNLARRSFLAVTAASAAIALGVPQIAHSTAEPWSLGADKAFADEETPERSKKSYGMLIDARKCTGCGACLSACHRQNNLKDGMDFIRFESHRQIHANGSYLQTVPLQCMHCEDAPCASVCPTKATYIKDDGVVAIDQQRCIGCKYCMAACPFEARVYDEEEGTVDKCRLCASRAEESNELMITCVQACINGVRIFGDLNDPESELCGAISRTGATPLGEELAHAKIYYVG